MLKQRIYLMLSVVFIPLSLNAETTNTQECPKVIYLLSTPRSASTVFTCMMDARDDFEIMNEPGTDMFNDFCTLDQNHPVRSPYWIQEGHIRAATAGLFEPLKQEIVRHKNVFIKDLAFAASGYVCDTNFLAQQNASFVFLVRHPHDVWVSFAKKIKFLESFCASYYLFMSAIDYTNLYRLFCQLRQTTARTPLIICSQELTNSPTDTMQRFCAYTKISFDPKHLVWDAKTASDFARLQEKWHCPGCSQEVMNHWYDRALASTEFTTLPTYETPEDIDTLFEHIQNPEHRTFYKNLYEENLKVYHLMLEEYVKQRTSPIS